MVIKYTALVLGKNVASILRKFESPQKNGTATYCEMIDNFTVLTWDHWLKAQETILFLQQYTSENDERFSWLKETFLNYFEEWKPYIDHRAGSFTQRTSKMFISFQNFLAFQITYYSVCTKFLLHEGMEYLLTERFSQNVLEQYFGN